jgi:general secretion pathway protein G
LNTTFAGDGNGSAVQLPGDGGSVLEHQLRVHREGKAARPIVGRVDSERSERTNARPRRRSDLSAYCLAAMRHKGFTLLELLVVVAIIGVLAGYVGPRYFSQIGKSEVNAARAQIDALEKALDQYRIDTGAYPNAQAGLGALLAPPSSEPKWAGPYLKKALPPDPWGRPYVYRLNENGSVAIISYGKDGQPGGTGENADIGNQ